MEQVEVRILGLTITQRYGTLNTGDLLRTDAEFAKHLVDDAAAAEYVQASAPPAAPPAPSKPPVKSPVKK